VKSIVCIVLFVLGIASGCKPPERTYPYMRGPIKVYWENSGLGAWQGIVELPGGKCYFRDVRSGGFSADKVTMTEMACPESEAK
jgi:hypothetical protein